MGLGLRVVNRGFRALGLSIGGLGFRVEGVGGMFTHWFLRVPFRV